jgi:hypothetical protein
MLYRFLPPYVGRGPGTRSRHWRGRGWRRGGSARGCPDAAAETEEFLRRDEWASGKGLVHGSTREEFPQGLRKKSERKANLAKDESAGAKQAAEKDLFLAEMPENRTSGAKAHDDCIALMSGINPGPTARTSFSAACKARLILLALSARLKPCPCYKAPWRLAAALRDAKQGIRARSPDSASLHPGLFSFLPSGKKAVASPCRRGIPGQSHERGRAGRKRLAAPYGTRNKGYGRGPRIPLLSIRGYFENVS